MSSFLSPSLNVNDEIILGAVRCRAERNNSSAIVILSLFHSNYIIRTETDEEPKRRYSVWSTSPYADFCTRY
ncbi:MAG: hypothetical protein GXY48_14480 [Methanomicrobiales archaeon]|nr:hypothetical protein [Methanomicrobiales archaeon]